MLPGGSLAGFLFSLHPCLFQFSLFPHLLKLKVELPFPLIALEYRPWIPSNPIVPSGVHYHRCENGSDYNTEHEVPHRGFVRLLSV